MCLEKYIQYEVYLTKHVKIQIYKIRQIPDKLGHDTFLICYSPVILPFSDM
jgi:hypothetical protein